AQFLESNAQLEMKSTEVKVSIAATEADVNRLAQQEADLRSRLAFTEEELKRLRAEARATQERRAELQVMLARAESDLKHLEETCQKELEMPLGRLVEGMETVAGEPALQDIDAKYAEVLRKIEALGPVNPQALEEFEEAQQRQEFLAAQRQDLAESGVDIVASPPGKKLQSVLLLSGGEKSLTAMALLMGIFQYAPSPFCILDEIDAPLDEPNIERLTRL